MIGKIVLTLIVLCAVLMLFSHQNRAKRSRRILRKLYKRQRKTLGAKKREEVIQSLRRDDFDILVIGGGSSGVGCALDAATRGLRVALVESLDYGSETSSKSTKLLHGGLRYLIKAVDGFSIRQLLLVFSALRERKTIMRMAPYLTYTVRIMIPIYSMVKAPYYWLLVKLYDWLSWSSTLGRSYLISNRRACMYFRSLNRDGLWGSMVYYDGMMDDSRLNVMLAVTASFYGATVANHMRFLDFIKDNNVIKGAVCIDELKGQRVEIKCKVVVSTVGAFTDEIRKKNAEHSEKIMAESAGTHIILPSEFGPESIGLVDTCTEDNRIMFILPWKGQTLVGSTEVSRPLTVQADPTGREIDFLISETRKYVKKEIEQSDVMSAWTGYRPLLKDSTKEKTESLVRYFSITDEHNGLVVMTGGKWTTFRASAEKVIDMAVQGYGLRCKNECLTEFVEVLGSKRYSRDMFYEISRLLKVDIEYAKHLLTMYGDRALMLGEYLERYPKSISEKYPFRAGEVIYCVEHEGAMTTSGVVNNRFGIGFYDVMEAARVCEEVEKILAEHFGWSEHESIKESEYTRKSLESLGYGIISKIEK